MTHGDRLRVLLLYAIPRRIAPEDNTSGTRPDTIDQWQMLSAQGIDIEIMDPTPLPLNPFAGRHSLYQSLDPYRALKVLLARRRVDLVIVANDGGALFLVLLRRLCRFKPPIVIWDLCPTPDWRVRDRLQDYVVPRVDGVLAIHSSQAPYIAERWGRQIPVGVTGLSIDTDFYHPRHNEPPQSPSATMPSGISPPWLPRWQAFKRISSSRPDARCLSIHADTAPSGWCRSVWTLRRSVLSMPAAGS